MVRRCRGGMQADPWLGRRLGWEAWGHGQGYRQPARATSPPTPALPACHPGHPTFRTAARSPRGPCPRVWVRGEAGAQPVLTLTPPRFCCKSSTRCGPWSLWGRCVSSRGGPAAHAPRPTAHCPRAHRLTKTLLMQPLKLGKIPDSGWPPRESCGGPSGVGSLGPWCLIVGCSWSST